MSIALPAVQAVRENARRTNCLAKLRQVGNAAANYNSVFKRLPPGTLGFEEAFEFDEHWYDANSQFYGKRAQHTSALGLLLPYSDLQNEAKLIDPVAFQPGLFIDEVHLTTEVAWVGELDGFLELATKKIPQFLCPSDNLMDAKVVFGGSQPNTQGGEKTDGFGAFNLQDDLPADYGLTNYLGCSGAHSGGKHPDIERQPYTGAMRSRQGLRVANIKDGSSHTIMFGETIGLIAERKRLGAQAWLLGGLGRGRGAIPWMLETHPRLWHFRHLGNSKQAHAFGFGSMHPGSVNFTFVDGSVRSMSRELNWQVLYQICGANDGHIPEL